MATVLIAEDDGLQASAMRAALGDAGLRVQSVANGNELLGRLAFALPDILVIDHAMPGRTGFEALRALRRTGRHRARPVLMISAQRDPQLVLQALRNGADDFLPKPFSAEQLRERVANLLKPQPCRRNSAA